MARRTTRSSGATGASRTAGRSSNGSARSSTPAVGTTSSSSTASRPDCRSSTRTAPISTRCRAKFAIRSRRWACDASGCSSTTSRAGSSTTSIGPRSRIWPMPTSRSSGASSSGSGPIDGLIVCPTVYYGRGDEDYLVRLGAAIDPQVDLFWSGRAICSPDAGPRRRRDVRASDGSAADVLGQLPGQRRGDELGAAHRSLPRTRSGAPPVGPRRDRQRDGAVRVVEDRARHDRRLPRRPGRLRSRGELAPGDPRRRGRGRRRRVRAVRRQRPLVVPGRRRRSDRHGRPGGLRLPVVAGRPRGARDATSERSQIGCAPPPSTSSADRSATPRSSRSVDPGSKRSRSGRLPSATLLGSPRPAVWRRMRP